MKKEETKSEEVKETKKKYILLQSEYTLSYSENEFYINDKGVNIKTEEKKYNIEDICNEKKKLFYDSFLKRYFKNVIVLTAAGTSIDNGDKVNSGKTRKELWDFCKTEIDAIVDLNTDFKEKLFYINNDFEGLLSHIILFEKLNGEIKKGDKVLRKALELKIAEACKLQLQQQAPHKDFLNKIIARKPSDPRVQLFTTNYDLLFEKAANESGFVVIDGFSFTQPRKFSGRYF